MCVCVCVSNLNRDVCVGVSPVKNGSEVELRVSLRLENSGPDGVVLTAHYSVNIWSCRSQEEEEEEEQRRRQAATFNQVLHLRTIVRYFQRETLYFILHYVNLTVVVQFRGFQINIFHKKTCNKLLKYNFSRIKAAAGLVWTH